LQYLTFEQFLLFYEKKKKFPDGSYVSPKGYNDSQIRSKYKKYCKSVEKYDARMKVQTKASLSKKEERLLRIDEKWENVKEIVNKRDKKKCRLYITLTDKEKELVDKELRGRFKTIDRAHVFNRTCYPHMKYNTANVMCLYRLFHSRIDNYKNPVSDESITNEERIEWWKRIVGEERYENLLNIANKREEK